MSFLNNDVFPAGLVLPYAGSTAPTGWLLCNTATPIAIASYPRLYSAIGNSYNGGVTPGDGVTTFNLPNLSGVFPRGAGTQTISSVSYSGTRGTYQADQMQGHKHLGPIGVTGGVAANPGTNVNAQYTNGGAGSTAWSGSGTDAYFTDSTNSPGRGPSIGSETRPANVGINYIIKI